MKEARKRIAGKIRITKNGCWEWIGNPRENGYCRTTYKRKNWYVHRLAYTAFVGEIPKGMDICHKCDNRKCCNPNHLFVGTRKDNMEDCKDKGRTAKGFKLPQTKLTEEDKKKIVEFAKTGEKYAEIAKLFRIHWVTVGVIALKNGVRRHVWNK